MTVAARLAQPEDLGALERLYARLSAEQREIRSIWPYADGLPEPVAESLGAMVDQQDTIVVVGGIDGVLRHQRHVLAAADQGGGAAVQDLDDIAANFESINLKSFSFCHIKNLFLKFNVL